MVLVTGGSGLVGSHLLFDLTRAGEKVRAIKRASSDTAMVRKVFAHYSEEADFLFDSIEWVDADLLDYHTLLDALEGVERVYHCAAMVSFFPRDVKHMMKANIEGTANLVNACLEKTINKLCYVSSTAAIGRDKTGTIITEDNKWEISKMNSNYAVSKYCAEREVWRGSIEGLPCVMVNPSIIVGPGDWNKSSISVFKTVWKGLRFYTGGANGFVDARDVSGAMIKLMNSDITEERFLVVGENLSFFQFFSHIAASLNKKPPSIKAGKFVTEVAQRLLGLASKVTGKSPKITRETLRAAHSKAEYSTEKVKAAIGMEFTPIAEATKNAGAFFLKQQSSLP